MQTYKYPTMVCCLAAVLLGSLTPRSAHAQSEGGLLMEVEASKKVNRQLSIGVEADLRTRNNFKTMDRWKVGIGADYKFTKWLKASAGYALINSNFREKVTKNAPTLYNNWTPSYWGTKHRFYASLAGSYKFANHIKVSLRERWQYTYRPEKTVTRWDFDNAKWEDKVKSGKGKNQLRSRLTVSYDRKRALLTPYASVELYNSWAVEKVRYTAGVDIRLNKKHSLEVFYRFQDMRQQDDEDPDMHYLGVGYQFKF